MQIIHCEPHNIHLFPTLIRLVNLADSMGIPLTIQFTPQWAISILPDPAKLDTVRNWQKRGHEIGAHHHGIEAGNGWDGYTDHPPNEFPNPSKFNGRMDDFMMLLNQVGGDSLILSATIGDDFDWPVGIPYRTNGHLISHAISQPTTEILNSQTVYTLGITGVTHMARTDSAITHYASATTGDVFGAVTHVYNFDENETFLRKWWNFIQSKDCKTHRQIMRKRGYPSSTWIPGENGLIRPNPDRIQLYQNFPNPFNATTIIHFHLQKSIHVTLEVYDVLGRHVITLIDTKKPQGMHYETFNAKGLSSGIYYYQLRGADILQTKNMLYIQ